MKCCKMDPKMAEDHNPLDVNMKWREITWLNSVAPTVSQDSSTFPRTKMTNLSTNFSQKTLEHLFGYRICKGSPLASVGMLSQEKQQDK